jgi:hypothetical protein
MRAKYLYQVLHARGESRNCVYRNDEGKEHGGDQDPHDKAPPEISVTWKYNVNMKEETNQGIPEPPV